MTRQVYADKQSSELMNPCRVEDNCLPAEVPGSNLERTFSSSNKGDNLTVGRHPLCPSLCAYSASVQYSSIVGSLASPQYQSQLSLNGPLYHLGRLEENYGFSPFFRPQTRWVVASSSSRPIFPHTSYHPSAPQGLAVH